MEKQYKIGRLAAIKNELKKIVKDAHDGNVDKALAAEKILSLREEMDKLIQDLNEIEHK
jgi:hypothetical protein